MFKQKKIPKSINVCFKIFNQLSSMMKDSPSIWQACQLIQILCIVSFLILQNFGYSTTPEQLTVNNVLSRESFRYHFQYSAASHYSSFSLPATQNIDFSTTQAHYKFTEAYSRRIALYSPLISLQWRCSIILLGSFCLLKLHNLLDNQEAAIYLLQSVIFWSIWSKVLSS